MYTFFKLTICFLHTICCKGHIKHMPQIFMCEIFFNFYNIGFTGFFYWVVHYANYLGDTSFLSVVQFLCLDMVYILMDCISPPFSQKEVSCHKPLSVFCCTYEYPQDLFLLVVTHQSFVAVFPSVHVVNVSFA